MHLLVTVRETRLVSVWTHGYLTQCLSDRLVHSEQLVDLDHFTTLQTDLNNKLTVKLRHRVTHRMAEVQYLQCQITVQSTGVERLTVQESRAAVIALLAQGHRLQPTRC